MRNQGNARGFSHALLVGKLGRSIAHRLLLAGRGRLVFDKDAAATSAFQGTAASVATSLAELVSECDIACLCLPGPAEVEQVMLGGDSTDRSSDRARLWWIIRLIHPRLCGRSATGSKSEEPARPRRAVRRLRRPQALAAAAHREGIQVARCTVERLMRELGLKGVARGKLRRGQADSNLALPACTIRLEFEPTISTV